ncbi:hypothetical protein C8Q79DRAFT_975871 [Trametes meyenii]|nr:hypothetical protein C8Q79DRAFT_975871 [Trametes meyenii]
MPYVSLRGMTRLTRTHGTNKLGCSFPQTAQPHSHHISTVQTILTLSRRIPRAAARHACKLLASFFGSTPGPRARNNQKRICFCQIFKRYTVWDSRRSESPTCPRHNLAESRNTPGARTTRPPHTQAVYDSDIQPPLGRAGRRRMLETLY